MTSEGEYEQRQNDEFVLLQSVYGEDNVEDLTEKAAWNTWQPKKVKLKLFPLESQSPHAEVYAQVELIVNCSTRYPAVAPELELKNSKNVPEKKLEELKKELNVMAKEKLGDVMVFDLAEHVRGFLHAYNQPPPKSFHEQMMEKRKQAEQERLRKEHEQREQERRRREEEEHEIEDIKRRKQQELREERRRPRREGSLQSDDGRSEAPAMSSSPTLSVGLSPIIASPYPGSVTPSVIATPTVCPTANTTTRRPRRTSTPRRRSESENEDGEGKPRANNKEVLVFKRGQEERSVYKGSLKHSQGGGGSTVYFGKDVKSAQAVVVTEWVLQWKIVSKRKSQAKVAELDEDPEGREHLKQVQSIERETQPLVKLSHPNIVRYLGFEHQREAGKITIHVLTEFCGGTNFGALLRSGQPTSMEILRHHAQGMVNGLAYLHKQNIVHKLFRASCVFLDEQGTIRLADYALDAKLRTLYKEINRRSKVVQFKDQEDSTDLMPYARGNKRGDVCQLGVTVLALALGKYPEDTGSGITVPTNLPEPLVDFLNSCLNQHDNLSCEALAEHPFLRDPLPVPVSPSVQNDEDNDADDSQDENMAFYHVNANSKSRFELEFDSENKVELGKGGFGHVWKVRNFLDKRFYAVKRILLNPSSKHFSQKKITREVKLLSHLHHENIVRYYNAWIENTDDPAMSETSSAPETVSSRPSDYSRPARRPPPPPPKVVRRCDDSLEAFGNIEQFAPQAVGDSVDWSISRSVVAEDSSDDDDDDDEDDDDCHWRIGRSFLGRDLNGESDSRSDSIDFEDDEEEGSQNGRKDQGDKSLSQTDTPKKSESEDSSALWFAQPEAETPKLSYLYIQMQYCEHGTLRQAIDSGLSNDMDRVWQYFRGILQGLQYIHEQKMIHRDLKPVNILLDKDDLPRIGDFGLATTDVVKQKTGLADSTFNALALTDAVSFSRSGSCDGDMTGEVGTALYVSPEMMKGGAKVRYDQKVDMYSLGIIFFEMAYKSLPTSMERIQILTALRRPEIILPKDFDELGMLRPHAAVIRNLLDHDPAKRPSSREMLLSPLLPPVPEMETQFNERLQSAIGNRDGEVYRRIMASLFSNPFTTPMDKDKEKEYKQMDVTYNMDLTKPKHVSTMQGLLLHDLAVEKIEWVFQRHGAVRVNTPLLMPRPPQYAALARTLPCFLDKSGCVVNLPVDLRVPFARYVAHNNVLNLKRFCIERVYKQNKALNLHPREYVECAFDIVTTAKDCLLPDAELLTVVEQVINAFPVLQSRSYVVCLNHTKLVRAVLLHAGVPQDKLSRVIDTLARHKTQPNSEIMTEELIRECMQQHNITLTSTAETQLRVYLETEGDLSKTRQQLRALTKLQSKAGSHAKEGLAQLEIIRQHAEQAGLKLKVVVSLGLLYNLQYYSGMLFQVYYRKPHKKHKGFITEVLASGGRYDKLLSEFASRSILEQGAVGVSIAFDVALTALSHDKELQIPGPSDVVVCTVGYNRMLKERLTITTMLMEAGVRVELVYEPLENIEDIQNKCRTLGVPFLVILKDETISVKVRSLDARFAGTEKEKRVLVTELVEFILPKLSANKTVVPSLLHGPRDREVSEAVTSSGSTTTGSSGGGSSGGGGRGNERGGVCKSSSTPALTFTYPYQLNQCQSAYNRRRYEGHASNKMPKWVTGEVEVVMVDLDAKAMKTIQGYIELNKEESDFMKSVDEIYEILGNKRKYNLPSIMENISRIRFEKRKHFIPLYSVHCEVLKVLT